MKRIFLILMLLIALNAVSASPQFENWFYSSDKIEVNVNIHSEMSIIPKSEDYSLDYVKAQLMFYPRDDFRQKAAGKEISGKYEENDDIISFTWNNPLAKTLEYSVIAKVQAENKLVQVDKKIKFPIQSEIPVELNNYLKQTELIDYSDPEITKLAQQLATGEDNLYAVAAKFAEWTKSNIKYDLSTKNTEASIKASDVLKNRNGVCDELTNLFIAMLRSVGIPAKFVAGIAYTNSELFSEKYGAHGWSEVYFPGYGWVPFDVTYGQYGWVDATHIKLKESYDSDRTSTKFEWRGKEVDLEAQELNISAVVTDYGKKIPPRAKLSAEIVKNIVGIGSYNMLKVRVENLNEHYLVEEILISDSEGLELKDDSHKIVVLGPDEDKAVFFRVKVKNDLEKEYIYTFNLMAYNLFNDSSTASFKVKKDEKSYSLVEMELIKQGYAEQEERIYSKDILLECNSEREHYYPLDTAKIICKIKNNGNTVQNGINVCYKTCKKIDLNIAQEETAEFEAEKLEIGKQDILINAKNKDISKTTSVKFDVLDNPKIGIVDIKYPESVKFDEDFTISFRLVKESISAPKNVNILLNYNNVPQKWNLNSLDEDRIFNVHINKRELAKTENSFMLAVSFSDDINNTYDIKRDFKINVTNISFWARIRMLLNSAAGAIAGAFS